MPQARKQKAAAKKTAAKKTAAKKTAARKTTAKKTASRVRSDPAAASRNAGPAPTRAQAEFDRYRARMSMAPDGGHAPFGGPDYPPPGGVLGWGIPPSMAGSAGPRGGPWAPGPGAPHFGPGGVSPAEQGGSLSDRLGTTLRLGLDALNAGLAGGIRALGGIAGTASALGASAYGTMTGAGCGCEHWYGHGCECGSGCCGAHHHGCHDCCCQMDAGHPDCCCEGSVGSCCG